MTNLERAKTIITEYFGEEKTDFVAAFDDCTKCLVWFPNVRVSNEQNQSTWIRDLYVAFSINDNGTMRGTFTMNRTTYTKAEVRSGYIHSHCSGQPARGQDVFYSCCLGTGPLVSIVSSLASTFDENMWMLFCAELDSYTKTESLAGIPYRALAHIRDYDGYPIFDGSIKLCKRKLDYYFSAVSNIAANILEDKAIPFVYNNGVYKFAIPDIDVFLKINSYAVDYADRSRRRGSVYNIEKMSCFVDGNKVYRNTTSQSRINNITAGSYITFKGERRPFVVDEEDSDTTTEDIECVYESIIESVATVLLELINCGT